MERPEDFATLCVRTMKRFLFEVPPGSEHRWSIPYVRQGERGGSVITAVKLTTRVIVKLVLPAVPVDKVILTLEAYGHIPKAGEWTEKDVLEIL